MSCQSAPGVCSCTQQCQSVPIIAAYQCSSISATSS
ncbi:unnamed protein product, partial [Staurois parvus]